jgi:hypothetical protein
VAALAILGATSPAGYARQSPNKTGITGRVITTAGDPVVQASVALVPIGGSLRTARECQTNDKGAFSFEAVGPGAYSILAVDEAILDFSADEENDNFGAPRICRPGDFVEIVVAREKPGVITGRVTGADGEPIVEAIVRTFRVRDSRGRPVQSRSPFGSSVSRKTDDRGVYRIWSLEPGQYYVTAGGEPDHGITFRSPEPTDYDADAPTYYTDSPVKAQTPVLVRPGAEVSGVDIQYRGGSGHTISGTLSGILASDARNFRVYLTNVATRIQQSEYVSRRAGGTPSFEIPKLPDGDYDVVAVGERGPSEYETASKTIRVTVKGADVPGVVLTPIEFASVDGRVSLEPTYDQESRAAIASKASDPECRPGRTRLIEETVLVFTRGQQSPGLADLEHPYGSSIAVRVDSKGHFVAPKLDPGDYYIRADLPEDLWYVSSIMAPGSGQKPVPVSFPLSIKGGEHVSPLAISLRAGAASLRGKIALSSGSAVSTTGLHIHLVPLDQQEADNPLRFTETSIKPGRTFTFAHVARGQYKVLIRPVEEGVERQLGETREGRALLRRAAERNGVKIQLQQCQKLVDLALKYSDGQ